LKTTLLHVVLWRTAISRYGDTSLRHKHADTRDVASTCARIAFVHTSKVYMASSKSETLSSQGSLFPSMSRGLMAFSRMGLKLSRKIWPCGLVADGHVEESFGSNIAQKTLVAKTTVAEKGTTHILVRHCDADDIVDQTKGQKTASAAPPHCLLQRERHQHRKKGMLSHCRQQNAEVNAPL